MGHPDEGLIRAFKDGEIAGRPGEMEGHLATCPQCARLAAEQEAVLATLGEALSLLDLAPPVGRARARFLHAQTSGRTPWGLVRRNIPRAASFAVLLTAGAAAALPGSPVRDWVVRGWEAISDGGSVTAVPQAPLPEALSAGPEGTGHPELVGATIPVAAGDIRLHIEEMAPGAEIRVLLVDGDRAGVFAGEGTRFRTEEGVLEARGAPGPITVEIPRGAPSVEMRVNGVTYLWMRGETLDLSGPVVERSPNEIRFGPSPTDSSLES